MGIKRYWVAAAAGLCILVPSREIAEPAWLSLNGHDWQRLSPEARQAYLAGFLAGSATAEVLDAGTADSAGLRQRLDSLSRSGFRFPFSPTVYGARVDDFYWYENQRPLPIWYTLWEVNNRLRDPSNGRQ
jgi:hypothetical protein